MGNSFDIIVIGVSAGGFKALKEFLPQFLNNFPIPIVIVQHRMEGSDNYLVESLSRFTKLKIVEPEDKTEIEPGNVYIAPAGYHLIIESDNSFSLSVDEPVSFARPSIDVLFESAANVYREKVIGIVMTGANSDGSKGIEMIKKNGGLTIAQDPNTAEVEMMPLSAIQTKAVDFILPLNEIPEFIIGLLRGANE